MPRGLGTALAAAQSRLPGSPGEGCLRERGFTLAIAQTHELGWGIERAMANRVIFPLTDPAGVVSERDWS